MFLKMKKPSRTYIVFNRKSISLCEEFDLWNELNVDLL